MRTPPWLLTITAQTHFRKRTLTFVGLRTHNALNTAPASEFSHLGSMMKFIRSHFVYNFFFTAGGHWLREYRFHTLL